MAPERHPARAVPPLASGAAAAYVPRHPDETPLYPAIETFLARARERDEVSA